MRRRFLSPVVRISGLLFGLHCCLGGAPAIALEVPFASADAINAVAVTGPRDLVGADIDRDGDLDVVTAAGEAGEVSWWENTAGDGSAWTEHSIDTAFLGASAVRVADVDGDGDPDVVATAFLDQDVNWWENDGTPADDVGGDGNSWTEHVIEDTFDGVRALEIVDLDTDGDLDVVAAASNADEIRWWENDGSPADDLGGDGNSWTERTPLGSFDGARGLAVADVDHDGDLDLLGVAEDANDVGWLENTAGDGTVWSTHVIETELSGAASVAAADLDGDGDLDVVATGSGANVIGWWESDGSPADDVGGDGNSWTQRLVTSGFGGARDALPADVDGDGDLDILATASTDDDVTWFENDGSGGTWTERTVDGAFDGAQVARWADLDGDGDGDVLSAASDGDVFAWWQNQTIHRSGLFPASLEVDTGGSNATDLQIGDIDGDGDDDIVAAWVTGVDDLHWFENTAGDGSAWTLHVIADINAPGTPRIVDLDQDGDQDVVVISGSDSTTWWENTSGDGTAWAEHEIDTVDADDLAIADLDGDGDLDVLATSRTDNFVKWWENDGSPADDIGGDGNSWTEHTIASGFDGRGVSASDIDGDGDLDVLGADFALSDIEWWENTTGDATTWTQRDIGISPGLPKSIIGADLDSDGDQDIVVSGSSSGHIYWFVNDGTPLDGGWVQERIEDTPDGLDGVQFIRVIDLDLDGDLDVVGAGKDVDELAWFESDGSPTGIDSWTEHTIAIRDSIQSVAVGDVTGDGLPDLVSTTGTAPELLELWQNHGGQFGLPTEDTAPLALADAGIDDVLVIEAFHRGRAGDSDVELTTFELLFEETEGDPLSDAEANALIENLSIYLDDGSGQWEVGDTLVTTVASLLLTAGVQTVTFTDGDINVQVAAEAAQTYFVVVELTPDASTQVPDVFQVTHLTESSSTGEDAANDLPLTLEFSSNVSSGQVKAGITCHSLGLSHGGMGLDPTGSPTASAGCAVGSYVAGEVITLTASPDPGYLVDGWSGTDNDASTSEMNILTMPDSAHAVLVNYAFPTDLVIEDTTYTAPGPDIIEACNSITSGVNVVVESGADVTFRAFTKVVVDNGLSVEDGAIFVIDLSVPVACP